MRALAFIYLLLGASSARANEPSPFEAEVRRLLEVAAGHATRTDECMDGGGTVANIAAVRVTLQRKGSAPVATVHYTAVNHAEGGWCLDGTGETCDKGHPTTRTARKLTLPFERTPAGYVLHAPAAVPGLHILTPLDRSHDTGCRGKQPAWVPQAIALETP